MEIKVVETKFGDYTNSIIIEYKDDSKKRVYDVRIKISNTDIYVSDYGVKIGKQREFRYMNVDSHVYRTLKVEERKEYEQNFIKENVPKEVLNLALDKFVESLRVMKF